MKIDYVKMSMEIGLSMYETTSFKFIDFLTFLIDFFQTLLYYSVCR